MDGLFGWFSPYSTGNKTDMGGRYLLSSTLQPYEVPARRVGDERCAVPRVAEKDQGDGRPGGDRTGKRERFLPHLEVTAEAGSARPDVKRVSGAGAADGSTGGQRWPVLSS